LKVVTLPDTLIALADESFYGCSSLKVVTLPATLASLGDGSFYGCSSLKVVTLPATLIAIGNYVFDGCSSLEVVTLPATLASLGDGSFYGCSSLKVVTLPGTLIAIGNNVFAGCSRLTTLFFGPSLATTAAAVAVDQPAVHLGINCSISGQTPITGTRYHLQGVNYDLCKAEFLKLRAETKEKYIAIERPLPLWIDKITTSIPITRVWAPDVIIAMIGGPFEGYSRCIDLPPALQAAPARMQSWAEVELWRWWTPPDVAGDTGDLAQFRLLSAEYRSVVWTILLVCERYAVMRVDEEVGGSGDGTVAVAPYGEVPVELWMLIFGFYQRDVPVQHMLFF
jgi:hypothetical protein